MDEPVAASGTIARIYRKKTEADAAVARLHEAGFADVRVSERAGTTTQDHVPAQTGLTEDDFRESLVRARFDAGDANRLTRAVAEGGTLITVTAPERVDDALAVLRGETIAARIIAPVDIAPVLETVVSPALAAASPTATPEIAHTGDRVIPLRAEQLDVSTDKKIVEARVRREVVTEQKTFTVPVQREELVVERDGADPVRIPVSDQTKNA